MSEGVTQVVGAAGVAGAAGAGGASGLAAGSAGAAIEASLAAFGFPVAVVLSSGGEELGRWGEVEREFPFASVTKPLVAWSALVAVERGMLSLEAKVGRKLFDADANPLPATMPTLEQVLSHSSGLASDAPTLITEPGRRRIYSNAGFDLLGRIIEEATGFEVGEWLEVSVLEPLGMTSVLLDGSPAHGASGNALDLSSFARELAAPTLISPALAARAQRVVGPELAGILPGYGRQKPNGFGLGVEVRGQKSPHWTGSGNLPQTFGHFGQSGSFVWVDPAVGRQAVFLGAKRFGARHQELWPGLNDELLEY